MRVLVVEDDAKIAAFVAKGSRQAGFAVDQAVDGEAGLHLALMCFYDVLDAPVIILSAKRSVDDRVNTAASAQ
jgi:two-component system, OmpR family, response regulator